jgi:prepilin-type N-terminal cleavage/methylation domain-containing protein
MRHTHQGFTLIELSIVLVIIGLIVGGVLTGQSLIAAAAVRAQITQIEKFNTAANTFFGKYGFLPGDIPATPAAQFGLASRGQYAGEGDGNELIEGLVSNQANGDNGFFEAGGETVMFWVDLSAMHLMDGGFSIAASSSTALNITGSGIASYLPQAKIGNGNYVYVWSDGGPNSPGKDGNEFGISVVTNLAASVDGGYMLSAPGLSVAQAYSLDTKVDDGLPQTGRVLAKYVWWNGSYPPMWVGTTDTSATPASSTTCYDNGNLGGIQHYSLTQNNGAGVNCALSFKMQAGD